MSPTRYVRALAAAIMLVLATGTLAAQVSTFRITNMSSASVNAYIGDSTLPLFSNLQSGGASTSTTGLLAQFLLRVTASQDSSLDLFTGSLATSLTQSLNLVLVDNGSNGTGSSVDTIGLLASNLNTIEIGRSQLRFVNTTSSALSFRITDDEGQVTTVANVAAGAAVDFSTVSDGIATIEVMSSATAQVIFSSRDTLANRGRQTLFATGEAMESIRLRVLDELDASAQASLRVLARLTASDSGQSRRLRVVNLFDGSTGLNISLNGEANDSLMFNEASELLSINDSTSAAFNISLGLLGGIGGSLFNDMFDLSNRDSVTDVIALRGALNSAQTITLRRGRTIGATNDSGLIRVVNASATANGMLDIEIISHNDTSNSGGLGFGQANSFSSFGSGRFTVGVRLAGSATFDRVFEGNLNAGSALTLLVTGDASDSTTFGISVLNELDLSAQRPLIRLRRLFGNDSAATRRFRAVQLVADLNSRIDIVVGDSAVIRNLGYREGSSVVSVDLADSISTTIGIVLAGTTTNLIEGLLNLGGSSGDSAAFTTMFSIGSIQAATARTVALETRSSDAAANGQAMIRVLNAVAADATPGTGGGYDLGFDLAGGGSLEFNALAFGNSTQYSSVASGNFTLHIMHNGDSTTMQTVQGTLQANATYTIALSGSGAAGRAGRDDRTLANSAAPVVDALLVQDLNGGQPAMGQGPIPVLGQVSSVGGVEIAAGLRVVPNPVNDVAYLRYGLGTSRTVSITLLDAKGAIAATFDVGTQTAGTYEVNLGVSRLPVGTYTAVLFDERGDRLGSTRLVIAR